MQTYMQWKNTRQKKVITKTKQNNKQQTMEEACQRVREKQGRRQRSIDITSGEEEKREEDHDVQS